MHNDYDSCGTQVPKGALQANFAQLVAPTHKQRLQQTKANLEAQLADVNAAIEAIEANPAVEQVLNALMKVGFR